MLEDGLTVFTLLTTLMYEMILPNLNTQMSLRIPNNWRKRVFELLLFVRKNPAKVSIGMVASTSIQNLDFKY